MNPGAFQCSLAARPPGGVAARVSRLARNMQRRVGLYAFGMTPLPLAPDRTAEHVAKRLAARRAELRLSLAEVAARCGVSLQQIHRYEVGLNTISVPMLWQLSRCLVVDIGYFFQGLESEV